MATTQGHCDPEGSPTPVVAGGQHALDWFAARQETTTSSPRRVELRPLPLLIRAIGARAYPNPLHFDRAHCVLGAGAEADMVLDSETVSRRHAELRLMPDGVSVSDLGSKNGCHYLGQRFQSMVLQPGSRFRLGTVELQIELDTEMLARRDAHEPERYGDLMGVSTAMRQLFSQLVRLEGSTVSLLIRGESGTGKELVARAIHEHSVLRRGPLVTVNCGALERNLVKSELFGHQRGAFTGAVASQPGAFVAAHGGTLFLDEIGELPLDVQPVLLRALESRTITPVGSPIERPIDVRVIAATHRDLHELVASGQFREDLLYRIQVVCLEIPPLRSRPEDIPVLALGLANRRGASQLPADFLAAFRNYTWPGNVRELSNAVEAFLALGAPPRPARAARAPAMDAALAAFVDPEQAYADQKNQIVELFTRAYLQRLMQATAGNQSQAARVSGLERSYLSKLIAKWGIQRER